MLIRGQTFTYPPKGFELPPKPASDSDPWQGYLDVLEIQGRPPVVENEFHLAYTRLTDRQFSAEQLAAKLAAENPSDPLPDTLRDWQKACWRPWQQRHWGHRHHPGGWGGGGYREPWSGRYSSGHRC
jgi:hypothetical protein